MPIISVRDNGNHRGNGNANKTQKNLDRHKRTSKTKPILKEWELNDFVVHLS